MVAVAVIDRRFTLPGRSKWHVHPRTIVQRYTVQPLLDRHPLDIPVRQAAPHLVRTAPRLVLIEVKHRSVLCFRPFRLVPVD